MDFNPASTNYPGMWRFPTNPEHCCIYRVPNSIRRANPEAYTPQLLIIGPLHRPLISKALKSVGDITDTKSMGYLNMEAHKKIYLAEFALKFEGQETINRLRRIIEEDEEIIRESYSESIAWIESPEFVDMILHDSVFIYEFILKSIQGPHKPGDPLMDQDCLYSKAYDDIMLLENQLPYFILEKLFDPFLDRNSRIKTFRELIIYCFNFEGNIQNNSKFRHFTDLFRCVRVETLPRLAQITKPVEHIYNADKLRTGGVKFEALEENLWLNVKFENGCLKMPCLIIDDKVEMLLRNIMALEQCHYGSSASHVSNYIFFLKELIDTEKDVELLLEKGIIQNWSGQLSSVAKMVNKLGLGMITSGSNYYDIAIQVNAHYSNPFNKSRALLKHAYFANLWTGTATVAATFLLVMTLIQTVASIIQVMQNS